MLPDISFAELMELCQSLICLCIPAIIAYGIPALVIFWFIRTRKDRRAMRDRPKQPRQPRSAPISDEGDSDDWTAEEMSDYFDQKEQDGPGVIGTLLGHFRDDITGRYPGSEDED